MCIIQHIDSPSFSSNIAQLYQSTIHSLDKYKYIFRICFDSRECRVSDAFKLFNRFLNDKHDVDVNVVHIARAVNKTYKCWTTLSRHFKSIFVTGKHPSRTIEVAGKGIYSCGMRGWWLFVTEI